MSLTCGVGELLDWKFGGVRSSYGSTVGKEHTDAVVGGFDVVARAMHH
jgi:hypothetical protein